MDQKEEKTDTNKYKTAQNYDLHLSKGGIKEQPKESVAPHDAQVSQDTSVRPWQSISSLIVAMWMFVTVLFYMLRFSASVWDAGQRGICGL